MTQTSLEGTIIRLDARIAHVALGDETFLCSIRGRLFEENTTETRPLAVGDRVKVTLDGSQGVIEQRAPRSSRLIRRATYGERTQVIAANVDLALLVVATQDPPLRPGLIDRMLVACEREGISPVVVVNKVDLGDRRRVSDDLVIYPPLGYEVLFTSVRTGEGIEELAEKLRDHVAVFVGHSGVGKSSILNTIQPGLRLQTGELNSRRRTGRHTTTHVKLLRLDRGGFVIDTPGVRSFSVAGVPPQELALYFPEMETLRETCRFPDCLHDREPHCAIKAGVEDKTIAPSRYESYRRILENLRGGGERAPRHDSYT